ncbi:MAG: hypothetical protein IT537_15310 [Hyphomicrobiales bacterium]|nr:hypothetical protein [Hyphomicrobiales bacterium]
MAKRQRQERYLKQGAGAGLVRVEILVPAEGRDAILRHASRLREAARARRLARGQQRAIDVEQVLAKVREQCTRLSRSAAPSADPDRLIVTSVNVPFANRIDKEGLVSALRTGRIPKGFRGHLERLLGETPLSRLLAFFDRNDIDSATVERFVREHGHDLALHRPDLQEHLRALSGG